MVSTRLLTSANTLPRSGYRIAFIGDSLCEHAHTKSYTGTPDVTGTLTSFSMMSESWITWLQTLSYGAIQCPIWADQSNHGTTWLSTGYQRGFTGMNFGVNGQTSAEILARMTTTTDTNVFDFDFDIAFFAPGSNDLSGAVAPDTTVANIVAGVDLLVAAGKQVFLFPIRARSISGSGSWTSASNSRKKVRYINQQVRHQLRRRPGVFVLNWDKAWADSTTTDGEPITGYTIDQVHDAIPGGYAIAKYLWLGKIGTTQVWSGLQAFFPEQPGNYNVIEDVFDATYNPYGNLFPNGMMTGTGGTATTGVTGTVASSLTCERSAAGSTTAVASKETSTNNTGFRQVLTYTPGGVAAETFYSPRGTTSTVTLDASLRDSGKWFQASVDVEVTGAYDKLNAIELYVNEVQPNITYRGMVAQSGSFMPNETWQGRIFTTPFRIQTGTTQLRPRVQTIITGGGTGTPVHKFGRFDLRQIEDPRISYNYNGPTYGE